MPNDSTDTFILCQFIGNSSCFRRITFIVFSYQFNLFPFHSWISIGQFYSQRRAIFNSISILGTSSCQRYSNTNFNYTRI